MTTRLGDYFPDQPAVGGAPRQTETTQSASGEGGLLRDLYETAIGNIKKAQEAPFQTYIELVHKYEFYGTKERYEKIHRMSVESVEQGSLLDITAECRVEEDHICKTFIPFVLECAREGEKRPQEEVTKCCASLQNLYERYGHCSPKDSNFKGCKKEPIVSSLCDCRPKSSPLKQNLIQLKKIIAHTKFKGAMLFVPYLKNGVRRELEFGWVDDSYGNALYMGSTRDVTKESENRLQVPSVHSELVQHGTEGSLFETVEEAANSGKEAMTFFIYIYRDMLGDKKYHSFKDDIEEAIQKCEKVLQIINELKEEARKGIGSLKTMREDVLSFTYQFNHCMTRYVLVVPPLPVHGGNGMPYLANLRNVPWSLIISFDRRCETKNQGFWWWMTESEPRSPERTFRNLYPYDVMVSSDEYEEFKAAQKDDVVSTYCFHARNTVGKEDEAARVQGESQESSCQQVSDDWISAVMDGSGVQRNIVVVLLCYDGYAKKPEFVDGAGDYEGQKFHYWKQKTLETTDDCKEDQYFFACEMRKLLGKFVSRTPRGRDTRHSQHFFPPTRFLMLSDGKEPDFLTQRGYSRDGCKYYTSSPYRPITRNEVGTSEMPARIKLRVAGIKLEDFCDQVLPVRPDASKRAWIYLPLSRDDQYRMPRRTYRKYKKVNHMKILHRDVVEEEYDDAGRKFGKKLETDEEKSDYAKESRFKFARGEGRVSFITLDQNEAIYGIVLRKDEIGKMENKLNRVLTNAKNRLSHNPIVEFTVVHEIGTGGTTLARQVLFEKFRKTNICVILDHEKFEPNDESINLLLDLEKYTEEPVIILADGCVNEKYKGLYQKLHLLSNKRKSVFSIVLVSVKKYGEIGSSAEPDTQSSLDALYEVPKKLSEREKQCADHFWREIFTYMRENSDKIGLPDDEELGELFPGEKEPDVYNKMSCPGFFVFYFKGEKKKLDMHKKYIGTILKPWREIAFKKKKTPEEEDIAKAVQMLRYIALLQLYGKSEHVVHNFLNCLVLRKVTHVRPQDLTDRAKKILAGEDLLDEDVETDPDTRKRTEYFVVKDFLNDADAYLERQGKSFAPPANLISTDAQDDLKFWHWSVAELVLEELLLEHSSDDRLNTTLNTTCLAHLAICFLYDLSCYYNAIFHITGEPTIDQSALLDLIFYNKEQTTEFSELTEKIMSGGEVGNLDDAKKFLVYVDGLYNSGPSARELGRFFYKKMGRLKRGGEISLQLSWLVDSSAEANGQITMIGVEAVPHEPARGRVVPFRKGEEYLIKAIEKHKERIKKASRYTLRKGYKNYKKLYEERQISQSYDVYGNILREYLSFIIDNEGEVNEQINRLNSQLGESNPGGGKDDNTDGCCIPLRTLLSSKTRVNNVLDLVMNVWMNAVAQFEEGLKRDKTNMYCRCNLIKTNTLMLEAYQKIAFKEQVTPPIEWLVEVPSEKMHNLKLKGIGTSLKDLKVMVKQMRTDVFETWSGASNLSIAPSGKGPDPQKKVLQARLSFLVRFVLGREEEDDTRMTEEQKKEYKSKKRSQYHKIVERFKELIPGQSLDAETQCMLRRDIVLVIEEQEGLCHKKSDKFISSLQHTHAKMKDCVDVIDAGILPLIMKNIPFEWRRYKDKICSCTMEEYEKIAGTEIEERGGKRFNQYDVQQYFTYARYSRRPPDLDFCSEMLDSWRSNLIQGESPPALYYYYDLLIKCLQFLVNPTMDLKTEIDKITGDDAKKVSREIGPHVRDVVITKPEDRRRWDTLAMVREQRRGREIDITTSAFDPTEYRFEAKVDTEGNEKRREVEENDRRYVFIVGGDQGQPPYMLAFWKYSKQDPIPTGDAGEHLYLLLGFNGYGPIAWNLHTSTAVANRAGAPKTDGGKGKRRKNQFISCELKMGATPYLESTQDGRRECEGEGCRNDRLDNLKKCRTCFLSDAKQLGKDGAHYRFYCQCQRGCHATKKDRVYFVKSAKEREQKWVNWYGACDECHGCDIAGSPSLVCELSDIPFVERMYNFRKEFKSKDEMRRKLRSFNGEDEKRKYKKYLVSGDLQTSDSAGRKASHLQSFGRAADSVGAVKGAGKKRRSRGGGALSSETQRVSGDVQTSNAAGRKASPSFGRAADSVDAAKRAGIERFKKGLRTWKSKNGSSILNDDKIFTTSVFFVPNQKVYNMNMEDFAIKLTRDRGVKLKTGGEFKMRSKNTKTIDGYDKEEAAKIVASAEQGKKGPFFLPMACVTGATQCECDGHKCIWCVPPRIS